MEIINYRKDGFSNFYDLYVNQKRVGYVNIHDFATTSKSELLGNAFVFKSKSFLKWNTVLKNLNAECVGNITLDFSLVTAKIETKDSSYVYQRLFLGNVWHLRNAENTVITVRHSHLEADFNTEEELINILILYIMGLYVSDIYNKLRIYMTIILLSLIFILF